MAKSNIIENHTPPLDPAFKAAIANEVAKQLKDIEELFDVKFDYEAIAEICKKIF